MDTAGAETDLHIDAVTLGPMLGRGAEHVVYRGTMGEASVAVKIRNADARATEARDPRALQREVALLACIDHPNVVKTYRSGLADGRAYLVMELVTGVTLADLLRAEGPLSEQKTLDLARRIAAALAEVHRHGLVHRDLKPENMIIQANGAPKLIDFGLSARVVDRPVAGDTFVGTPTYAAPEQTGLVQEVVDARADLYGLGVILFECVAGRPPFTAQQQAEVLRMHVEAPVPDPRAFRPECGQALAAVIMRLLAKKPAERYRSARALQHDLTRLDELEQIVRRGESLTLAVGDNRDAEDLPLVGRTRELSVLRTAWVEAERSSGAFISVEGEGGLGKSHLTKSLLAIAKRGGAATFAGKAVRGSSTPFGVLRDALESYLRVLPDFPMEKRRRSEESLRTAARDIAPLLTRFSPALCEWLGVTDDREESVENYRQSVNAVAELWIRLAKEHGKLLLVIDDAHVIDQNSSEVLARIRNEIQSLPLLVVFTSRNDTVNLGALESIVALLGPALAARIKLDPLDHSAVAMLVSSRLGGRPLESDAAERIMRPLNGNPFAVTQFVDALLDAGLLIPDTGQWRLDENGLDAVALPVDVLELVLRRAGSLPEDARRFLSCAALDGATFRPERIAKALGVREGALDEAMSAARGFGFLNPVDVDQLAFAHDRVREAFASRMDESEKRQHHDLLASAILDEGSTRNENVFALAEHLNGGHPDRRPAIVFRANFDAARAARDVNANIQAYAYLERAKSYLGSADGSAELDVLEMLGDVCRRIGKVQEAREHLERGIRICRDDLRRAELYGVLAETDIMVFDSRRAVESVKEGLRAAGQPLPRFAPLRLLSALASVVIAIAIAVTGLGTGRDVGRQRMRRRVVASLHARGIRSAYFALQSPEMMEMTAHGLRTSMQLGPSRDLVETWGNLAILFAFFHVQSISKWISRHTLELARSLNDPATLARAHLDAALREHFAGDTIEADRKFQQVLVQSNVWLQTSDYAAGISAWSIAKEIRGYDREALDFNVGIAVAGTDIAQLSRVGRPTSAYSAAFLTHLGRRSEASVNAVEAEHNLDATEDTSFRIVARGLLSVYYAAKGQWTDVEDQLRRARLRFIVPLDPLHTRTFFIHQAHVRLAMARGATGSERERALRELDKAARVLWFVSHEPSFYAHAHAVRGAAAALRGRHAKARRLLARAEELARRVDCPWPLFEVHRTRAELHRAEGQVAAAVREASYAHLLAVQQGWMDRELQLRDEYGLQDAGSGALKSAGATPGVVNERTKRQLQALIDVSLAASNVVDPARQAKVALAAMAKVFHAERAFLFLVDRNNGSLQFKVGSDPEGLHVEAERYSTTLVERVRAERQAFVVSGTTEGELLGSRSAVLHDLRSILAGPLMLQERLVGVVYLDTRLASGVFTEEDAGVLLALAQNVAVFFEAAHVVQETMRQREVEREVEAAAFVQKMLLPAKTSAEQQGLTIAPYYRAATRCAGDWWSFDSSSDSRALLVVGDVTGHGLGPAMVTAAVAGTFQTFRQAFPEADAVALLGAIHDFLRGVVSGAYTMTATAVELDMQKNRLVFVNAGAPPVMRQTRDGELEILGGLSSPLGGENHELVRLERDWLPGDRLFVFTDGLLTVPTSKGRTMTLRNIRNMVTAQRGQRAPDASAAIVAELEAAVGKGELEDDVTMVMIDRER